MTVFLAILGALASAAGLYLFAEDMRSRRRFGWKQVTALVRRMLNEMQSLSYKPDLVVGIGRGGAILAGMLAGNLGHLPLVVLDTVIDHPNGIRRVEFRFPDCCPPLKGKRILLVVGELYSGEDLRHAIEFAQLQQPAEIKAASLLTHPAAVVKPDFVGRETGKPLSAPWRITDAYKVSRI